ncbi:ATP-dependent DNA helicase [Microbacterium excoecariae]|uniref:ATP-dependent DNA helicase n=1 Tax=Microbacterium excoecariae TaxID=2715210 RepID=UPI0030B88F5D
MQDPHHPGGQRVNGTRRLSAEVLALALGLNRPTVEQRAVIEADLGPALVVAGAGSGKTETMSARVIWLVANGHVRADEILGLTFTRKAAGELADRITRRLEQLDEYAHRGLLDDLDRVVAHPEFARIEAASEPQRPAVRREVLDRLAREFGSAPEGGPGGLDGLLDRPRVSTYNAFADALVRENAARIGRDPDAAMLSASAAWVLARQVAVRSQNAALADVDAALSSVADAIQQLAGALLDNRADPEAVRRHALRQAAELAPFVDPAIANPRDWERAHAALSTLPVLLDLAGEYAEEKRRRGVLDFSDQVSGALDVVDAAPDVVARLRAEHRVVLLDEYQDTSVLQTRLLASLFHDSAVMAVGDPNQAIYGWRGASADNIHGFARDFAADGRAQRFALLTSWRNGPTVLAAANRLVRPLAEDSVGELAPRPGVGADAVDVRVEKTVDEEARAVAEWFRERRDAAPTPPTGAVLFRTKRHMQTFADALGAAGVPHRILGLGGLLGLPEVADVVAALRVLHDPSQGSALIRILVGPRFAVGLADMAALYDLGRELARRDQGLAPLPADLRDRVRSSAGVDEQVSIVDALDAVRTLRDDYRLLAGFTPEGRERLRESAAMFDRLRRAAGQPLPDLLRMIEHELLLDIELAANESRGPARGADTQLRAFADEVRAFLAVDERGTIGSVLAWLEHAEKAGDLAPRTEPPEPGVVQLLTIHGSKGLEWDAVAVVRLVEGETPSAPQSVLGGFRFGELPTPFRGDAAALPRFTWIPASVPADAAGKRAAQKELKAAFEDFKAANREHLGDEERRLAYVAVTRAREALLLSASRWSGGSRSREASRFLLEILQELGRGELPPAHPEESNPYEGAGEHVAWPLDPLGARAERVRRAAAEVAAAPAAPPSPELAALLAERAEAALGARGEVPLRVAASKFKDFATDFRGTLDELLRPMPERPYRQTRLGTLFHQWVEERSRVSGAPRGADDALWEIDEDEADAPGAARAASPEDERSLARLRAIFERSEWADLQPLEVETEVDFTLDLEGTGPRVIICKLDAVYRREDRGGRIEIVDWKTGRAPATPAEREDRMLQLGLYRLAYHRRHGVPLADIDVALFYVADELVLRDDQPLSEAELVTRWRSARGEAIER